MCIAMQNLVEISQMIAEILQFLDFQDGCSLPYCIFKNAIFSSRTDQEGQCTSLYQISSIGQMNLKISRLMVLKMAAVRHIGSLMRYVAKFPWPNDFQDGRWHGWETPTHVPKMSIWRI